MYPGVALILPGATWLNSKRISAADVLHVYRKRQPRQLRDGKHPITCNLQGVTNVGLIMNIKVRVNGSWGRCFDCSQDTGDRRRKVTPPAAAGGGDGPTALRLLHP